MSYRCPRISRRYACTMARTFRNILNGILSYGDRRIGDLDVVSEEDKQRMLLWNPKALFVQMTCIHYLVEATARVIPEAEAVCAWDGSRTYSQLDVLSSIAAESLIQVGVGPGVYVPFAYEKSLWTVVATLAILKAGGALVPIDPTHPRARLEEILKEVQASVVVTSDTYASVFREVEHVVVVVISASTISTHHYDKATAYCSSSLVGPTDPAFVLFTSGSTGRPKGIIHEHGSICTHALAHGETMRYHRARVLQFAAHTFDVALIDIFTTLVFGGCVCIPSEEGRRNDITGAINSLKADYALLTPSFAALIEPSEVPTLRTLAIGGEAVTQEHIQRWADKLSLISIYGPAEVGICTTIPVYPGAAVPETVGYALPNSSCWLVNPENPHRLVPIGAVGELMVAGPSLARCYLNDEGKTRSSFLENLAWADEMGLKCGRFYRTGDLLRYSTTSFDGSFDFVRRKDTQIKVRGQRVESGEVEHHIASIPGVAVSMVTHPKQGCFAGELVAVVQMRSTETLRILNEPISLSSEQCLSAETIKLHLSKALPSYMIPTVCIVVNSMPFVPSLKIDRRRVNDWLMAMETRPAELTQVTLVDLGISDLGPNEVTAKELSVRIADIVARNDKVKQSALANHDFVLHKAGIDSIQIISLSMFLQRIYSVKVPMEKLLSSKLTIRELAYLIDHRSSMPMLSDVSATVEVRQEAELLTKRLFQDIEGHTLNHDSGRRVCGEEIPIRNILLTGASGFLGSAILKHLLARPNIYIIALVRCLSKSEGLQRLVDSATKNGWWRDQYASRIEIWQGDLAKPNLGLGTQQLQYLLGTASQKGLHIHAIIHNGARVHYSTDYESLKPVNVLSTTDLLKLVGQSQSISTFLFVSGGLKPDATGQPRISRSNGYAQSKLVSEQLVDSCVEHGAFHTKRLSIVKPGYIIGSTSTGGIANQQDFVWRLIATCVEIGSYNAKESSHWLYISDNDRVALSIMSTLFESTHLPAGAVERVLDGLRFSDLWKTLEDEFGWKLEPVPYEDWMGRVKAKIAERQEAHLLFPLAHVLERDGGNIGSCKGPALDPEHAAKSTAIVRTAVIENVRHLIEAGFFPKPKAEQK